MAAKKEKKQKPLEQVLMESCNKLRSNMSGINYMYFVMGLVFLKFASLKFEKRREELLNSEDAFAVDMPSFYAEKNVFYIPEKARWSYISDNAKSARIGIIIDEALEELEKYNEQLKHALATSDDGENVSRYGKSSLPASNFASLIAEIDKIIIPTGVAVCPELRHHELSLGSIAAVGVFFHEAGILYTGFLRAFHVYQILGQNG